MKAPFKTALLTCALLALAAGLALSATFFTSTAVLSVGEQVTSRSPKNGNITGFFFAEITRNPGSEKSSAFVQWAPLMPRAKDYKNGTLVDQGGSLRVWINGIWYTLSFDGSKLRIR